MSLLGLRFFYNICRQQWHVAHHIEVVVVRTAQLNALNGADSNIRIVVLLFVVVHILVRFKRWRRIVKFNFWRFFGEVDVVIVVWFDWGKILECCVRFAFDVEENDTIAEWLNGSEIVGEMMTVGVLESAEFLELGNKF